MQNQLNQMCSYKIKILAFKFLKEQITNLERLSSDEYTNNKTCPFINANNHTKFQFAKIISPTLQLPSLCCTALVAIYQGQITMGQNYFQNIKQ